VARGGARREDPLLRRWLSLAGLLVALAGLAAAALDSARRVARQDAAARVCEAASAKDWARALEVPDDALGPDAEGRIAAECRCYAQLALDRAPECTALLDRLLDEPAARDWVPDATLTKLLIHTRLKEGRNAPALALARRAREVHPDDTGLLELEVITRSIVEGEDAVLADLAARLAADPTSPFTLRLLVAGIHHRRGDAGEALGALGETPPPPGDPYLASWFEQRAQSFAALGRIDDVRRAFADWRAAGGDPAELRARYALLVSLAQLRDPERSWVELLREAIREGDALRGRDLHRALHERLVAHLLVEGRSAEALAAFDAASEQYTLETISRDEIERNATLRGAPRGQLAHGEGVLEFRLAASAEGGTLLVSADPRQPPDTDFESHPLAPGQVQHVTRALGPWPQRWVLRDAVGRPRASGAVWPLAGEVARVEIAPPAPGGPPAGQPAVPARAAGDGRRRVFTMVLDCADWRLVQYLRARGELPFLDALLRTGHRAVLDSFPPLTATAMESLVWPGRGRQITFLGLVHHLGVELAGLASVGRNPVDFLAGLQPEGRSLFETVGAGDRVAANLLFSHGTIDAGRHAEVVGPDGARREAGSIRAIRPISDAERERFPVLATAPYPQFRSLVETIAAELDAAVEIARAGEVDLLVLRVEPLDLLTHALFHELNRTAQDDGRSPLLGVYRYLDARLAELDAALDRDDVLVVMSDHGIRTAMEHERDAIFVASGEDLPAQRVAGRPDLRGVPRALATLFGIETAWPGGELDRSVELALRDSGRRKLAGLGAGSGSAQ
jgi:hypothetical protein